MPGPAPGRPGWLSDGAERALVSCLDLTDPLVLRQACIRAVGVASVLSAEQPLRAILVSADPDPITVLLCARALSRLTHKDHVT